MAYISTGAQILSRSFQDLNSYYNEEHSKGFIGFLEMTGRTLVVVPAHLCSAVVLAPAFWIMDLALAYIFSGLTVLSFLFCSSYSLENLCNECGMHAGSMIMGPLVVISHIFAVLFPPLGHCVHRHVINPLVACLV